LDTGDAVYDKCSNWADGISATAGISGLPYTTNIYWTYGAYLTCDMEALLYYLED